MSDEKPLTYFYPKLLASDVVQKALRAELCDKAEHVTDLLQRGDELPGELDYIHELLYNLVHDEAKSVDSTSVEGSEAGEYEIEVMEFAGVYFVEAPQFDTIGYFETEAEASEAIRRNW